VGKPEGKKPLARPRLRWVDNIKMDLREIPLGAWMSVYAFFFRICIVLCVGNGLTTGSSPVQGVLPTVYKIRISELINSERGGPLREKKKMELIG
jgi:hypothetical protein